MFTYLSQNMQNITADIMKTGLNLKKRKKEKRKSSNMWQILTTDLVLKQVLAFGFGFF